MMPATRSLCRLVLCVFVLVCGCGAETYQARLNETAAYFRYQQKLNEELGPRWSDSELHVSFQPPRQFQSIAPPAPLPETDEGEPAALDAAEDPRQPHYLGIELPGLLGAWEATVPADVGGVEEPRTAYLYVLGNHYRYLQSPDSGGFVEEPLSFLADVENLLANTIGVVIPEGETGAGVEKNQRYRESAPRVEPNTRFTPRKDFTAIALSPQIDVGDLDLPFEIQLYEWAGQKIQLAILMVYPQSVSPRENLQDRLLLSLETLNVSDTAPSAGSTSGAGGGGGGGIAF